MTSISNTMPSFPMPPSPRARIDAKIAAATSAGTISQTDGTALETAVEAIGQSLRGGGASGASAGDTTATTSGSGTSFKDKLDGLIDAQVTSGTLTDAQATELKGMLGQGAPVQGTGGQDADTGQVAAKTGTTGAAPAAGGAVHGHHHHGGGGGMAAIMAALDGSDSTDGSTDTSAIDALTGTTATGTTSTGTAAASTTASATTSTTAVSSTDTATQQLDKLIGFLEKMRESIGSSQTYGSASASGSGTDAAGMVFSGIA